MKFQKKTQTAVKAQTAPTVDCKALHARVQMARAVSDTLITFTLAMDGLALYGLRLVATDNGTFIAPPSTKGKDGNYYRLYGVWLSEADEARITEILTNPDETRGVIPVYED